MKKELSQTLCQIIGIKQRYRIEGINALYTKEKYNELLEIRLQKGLLPPFCRGVLPDLSKPENFVMLLELKHKYSSNKIDGTEFIEYEPFVTQVLLKIIKDCEKYPMNEMGFISSVREYEDWIYEK